MVAQVADRLGEVHPPDRVADADALIEGGEDSLAQAAWQVSAGR